MTQARSAPRVALRDVLDADLPSFYAQQRDEASLQMAAFHARDAEAFREHWARVRTDPHAKVKSILADGSLVGHVGSWATPERRLVGYWIDRAEWGRGIASAALVQFVETIDRVRPLFAFVVSTNARSVRVLEKCGFVRVGEHEDGEVLEYEYVLR